MSDEQHALQDELVKRYERIRSAEGRSPRGQRPGHHHRRPQARPRRPDALGDGHGLPRLEGQRAGGERRSRSGERTAATRGTQMIFCDMGVNPTPWGYSRLRRDRRKAGRPAASPASRSPTIGDADTDAKKQALFEKVRQRPVRVLIGSTQKMGTGTNVQKRLVALHHLDAPWKPAEVEQRDGRILRQGNENEEVAVYRYVTEGSFDAYMWQALETKARFIAQVMTGEAAVRQAEDVGGQELSYAEVKAIASGNPAVLTLAEADAELQRLAVLRRNHADEQYIARRKLRELPESIDRLEKRLAAMQADMTTVQRNDQFSVSGKPGSEAALGAALARLPQFTDQIRRFPLGTYHGLAFGIERHTGGAADVYLEGQAFRTAQLAKESQGPRAVMNALGRLASSYRERCEETGRELALARTQFHDYEARLGRPFGHAAYLDELTGLRDRLKVALSGTPVEGEPSAEELAGQIKDRKASQQIEAAPARVRLQSNVEPLRRKAERQQAVPQSTPRVANPDNPKVGEDDAHGGSFRLRVSPKAAQKTLV